MHTGLCQSGMEGYEDIKVQCDVILNAWGRMRRARASRLYCNISFVKYSINTVASHYSCDTVTFGPRSEPAIPYSARIFKQVQPVVITTQQHLHSNLAIGYDSQKVLPSPPTQAVSVCYYEESDFFVPYCIV